MKNDIMTCSTTYYTHNTLNTVFFAILLAFMTILGGKGLLYMLHYTIMSYNGYLAINDLSLFIPEMNLITFTMLGMLYGSFTSKKGADTLSIASCVILISSAITHFHSTTSSSLIFANLIYHDGMRNHIIGLLYLFTGLCAINIPRVPNHYHYKCFELPLLMVFSTLGMSLMIYSNHFLIAYLGIELMSLPLYIMAAIDRKSIFSSEAGIKYFVLGTLSSCLLLFGISLIYAFSATLYFSDLNLYYYVVLNSSASVDEVVIPLIYILAIIKIICALGIKIGVVPFHFWAPDVYQGSPRISTMFMSSTPKIAIISFLSLLTYSAFIDQMGYISQIICVISAASIIIGALGALFQHNIIRLLAFSSISHAGFAMLGIVTGDISGLRALFIYLMTYGTLSIGIFSCLLFLRNKDEYICEIKDLSGLAKTHPYLSASIASFLLSMAGIPPFMGFFAKLYIFMSLMQQEIYWVCILASISSVIALYYYLYIIKVMYFGNKHEMDMECGNDVICSKKFCGVVAICFCINILYIFIYSNATILIESLLALVIK